MRKSVVVSHQSCRLEARQTIRNSAEPDGEDEPGAPLRVAAKGAKGAKASLCKVAYVGCICLYMLLL
jgi:hypothetical protein